MAHFGPRTGSYLLVAALPLGLAAVLPLDAGEPVSPPPAAAAAPASAAPALDRLKALAGEWIDVDGTMGMKGQVAVTYRVTGAGSAVVETDFPGTAHEMVTVYHRDGGDLVLTHYCSAGNQPRMRAKRAVGDVLAFDFDGGTNLDPAKDMHIHAVKIELLGEDEMRETWIGWKGGKPEEPPLVLHLKRKKG